MIFKIVSRFPHVFGTRVRGYRALWHSKTQLPRVFNARARCYRAFLAPERAVTARFCRPHARLPRTLALEHVITRVFSARVSSYQAFLAPACAVAARLQLPGCPKLIPNTEQQPLRIRFLLKSPFLRRPDRLALSFSGAFFIALRIL